MSGLNLPFVKKYKHIYILFIVMSVVLEMLKKRKKPTKKPKEEYIEILLMQEDI